jgi:hypothetical protein
MSPDACRFVSNSAEDVKWRWFTGARLTRPMFAMSRLLTPADKRLLAAIRDDVLTTMMVVSVTRPLPLPGLGRIGR